MGKASFAGTEEPLNGYEQKEDSSKKKEVAGNYDGQKSNKGISRARVELTQAEHQKARTDNQQKETQSDHVSLALLFPFYSPALIMVLCSAFPPFSFASPSASAFSPV
ncbi:MAG: hypothetical protein AB7W16_24155 [Candidatus Obscuribacterales bacterium]